jgi:hypothetical protein
MATALEQIKQHAENVSKAELPLELEKQHSS